MAVTRHTAKARRIRQAIALSFLLIAGAFISLGLQYWSASAIDAADREASRRTLSSQEPLMVFEQRLATEYLSSCIEVMSHWTFTIEPAADRLPLTVKCQAVADRQLAWDQPSAEAMLVYALTQSHAGRDAAALRYVAEAQELAPRDLWNAVKRIELVLSSLEAEQLGEYSTYFAREFQLLTDTYRGVDTAVALYTKYPSLRPALLSIADEMGAQERLRFVNRIRRTLGSE